MEKDKLLTELANVTPEQLSKIEELGHRWAKYGKDRIYFNLTDFGLHFERYKTGNISFAWVDDISISNCGCRRLLGVRPYFDVQKSKLVLTDYDGDGYDIIKKHIIDAITTAVE